MWVSEARQRTCDLIADLADDQLLGPQLAIVNPLLWEIGHIAWFQEKWVLRHAAGLPPIRADGDALYDSAAIPHDVRWDLFLPTREQTLAYLKTVRERVLERLLRHDLSPDDIYFTLLSVFHEDMHAEAIVYTRQTLGYPAPSNPRLAATQSRALDSGALDSGALNPPPRLQGDAEIPGGTFLLGATRDEPFVFDNEKWAHSVEVRPFAIARTAVTQAEFAAFVDEGGYREQRWWSNDGWQWREQARTDHPVYWQRETAGRWLRRNYDQCIPLEPARPVLHVNWYEAEAYCRWARRRLPTEAEWETAAASDAAGEGEATGNLARRKRRFPWGDAPPTSLHANLDGRATGCLDVNALPAGDSACGCRQMMGNAWEWTVSDFLPYPGFVADPYKEYSQPWFGSHKVLRGGCWATSARLLRNTWRNFYRPDRRDVWAGFRTCALRP